MPSWKVLLQELRESLPLSLANHLPRLTVADRRRYLLLKLAGVQIEGRPLIWAPLEIRPIGAAGRIEIGAGTFINSGVRFACPHPARIRLGQKVLIGPRVQFETANHNVLHEPGARRGLKPEDIVVEDEVWIGAGCLILPGVTIGRNAVIAAGAVVTRNVEAHSIVGGIPARLIKKL